MNKSIKQLIVARFHEILSKVATEQLPGGPPHARAVTRSTAPSVMAAVVPSIQYSISDESLGSGDGEDFQGYEIEFDIAIKLNLAKVRDAYDACDELAAVVQARVESDLQLRSDGGGGSALCNWVKYVGENPFTNEVNGPLAGTVLFYRVAYRRQRGRPDLKY